MVQPPLPVYHFRVLLRMVDLNNRWIKNKPKWHPRLLFGAVALLVHKVLGATTIPAQIKDVSDGINRTTAYSPGGKTAPTLTSDVSTSTTNSTTY